jgi:hypothetical protein
MDLFSGKKKRLEIKFECLMLASLYEVLCCLFRSDCSASTTPLLVLKYAREGVFVSAHLTDDIASSLELFWKIAEQHFVYLSIYLETSNCPPLICICISRSYSTHPNHRPTPRWTDIRIPLRNRRIDSRCGIEQTWKTQCWFCF